MIVKPVGASTLALQPGIFERGKGLVANRAPES